MNPVLPSVTPTGRSIAPSATDPDRSRPTPARSSRPSALAGFLRWVAVLVILFALVVSGYYLYVNVINRPPAEVYIVSRGTAVSAVYGTVTITSNAQLALFAQNSGYFHYAKDLGTLAIRLNGRVVKKDQVLGTVVDEIGLRQLESAKRDYESAVARQKNGPGSAGLLETAKSRRDALNKVPAASVPRVEREAAESDVGRLQTAVDNEILELQRMTDTAATALKAAEDQTRRTEIRAPFDGILTAINYNDNAYVTTNQSLFTVADATTYVSGEVNEEDVGALRKGMKAEVRLYAYSNQTFTATLDDVLPSPTANSSRYTVTLHLDQPPDNLMFGLTGEMNIILGRKENALIAPSRAINIDQALIVEDGVVEQRTVKIGYHKLDFSEVIEGIGEGDAVIVADQDAFKPGERVRAVKTNQGKK